jgi:DNA-binding MarR family transcriptional regulator
MKRKTYSRDDARNLLAGMGINPDENTRLVKELSRDGAIFEAVSAYKEVAKTAFTTPKTTNLRACEAEKAVSTQKAVGEGGFWGWLMPGWHE